MARIAYARKNENKVEDLRVRKDEVTSGALSALDAALDAWLIGDRNGSRQPSKPKQFHRQWQPKQRQPLAILLAKAELAGCLDSGKAAKPVLDSNGWENQVLDGDKLEPTTLDGMPANTGKQAPSWMLAAKEQLNKAITQGKANKPREIEQLSFAWLAEIPTTERHARHRQKRNVLEIDTITDAQLWFWS